MLDLCVKVIRHASLHEKIMPGLLDTAGQRDEQR